jgi:hypothetical protein
MENKQEMVVFGAMDFAGVLGGAIVLGTVVSFLVSIL